MNTLSNAIGSFGAMANHGKRICFCRHRESRNIWEYSKDPTPFVTHGIKVIAR